MDETYFQEARKETQKLIEKDKAAGVGSGYKDSAMRWTNWHCYDCSKLADRLWMKPIFVSEVVCAAVPVCDSCMAVYDKNVRAVKKEK